ncbi:MAG: ATP-binding cassette domain-containing protein [Paracoccaceae bacterium]|jgi:ATP-binding cassette subfamily C protein LapB|nr:ATP-binding cassette domain-containing protein [Paracoccaceae bacterium]
MNGVAARSTGPEEAPQPIPETAEIVRNPLQTVPEPRRSADIAAQPSVDPRILARADLVVVYASLLGRSLLRRDVIEAMVGDGHQDGTAQDGQDRTQALVQAFEACGLLSRLETAAAPSADLWPALAHMTGGQVVLVLEQSGNDPAATLTIYDTESPDNRLLVSLAEFQPYFAGTILRAEARVADLAQTHLAAARPAHWFWGEFTALRRPFADVMLGSFVANLLAVAVALFSLQVYDRVIPHQSQATLWVLAAGAILALVMEAALKMARAQLMDGAGRQIELTVQALLMDRILGARSDQPGRSPSQIFSAMREFGSVREFFTTATVGTLADIPFIFVFLLLVASIGGNVVWVLVLGGVLMVLPGFVMQRQMIRLTEEGQGASARAGRLLQEVIHEQETVKTLRGEERMRRIWAELTALSAHTSSEQRRLASMLTTWAQGVQQATYVAAVVLGAYLVFAGQFTVGSIIAVGILTGRTLAPLSQLAGTMARWGNVRTALDALEVIANAPQDREPDRHYLRRDRLAGHYELREMQFRYSAETATVLDIPALAILPGQRVAILGANGSGKSTFLRLLSGLYAPKRGRMLIDGTEMGQIEPRDARRAIGYLGQEVRLFAGTLRENLTFNLLERDDDRLMQALDFAGLGQFVKAHPRGLDLELSDGGAGLSIGQRQSVGWARLWLQNPSVCLLDEPTAALDQRLEATLISRLEGWLEGRTVVIATHRMPILSLTGRVMILQNGRLAVDGPRDQVLAHLATPAGGGM